MSQAEILQQRLKEDRAIQRSKKAKERRARRSESLHRRFGEDDRPYTEKNLRWKNLAYRGSYLCQAVSIAGAFYCVVRLVFEPSIMGALMTILFLVALIAFEALQRWTSDEFWDKFVRGVFSWKAALLNFGLIWPISIVITVFGFFMIGKDTGTNSQLTKDPAALAMQQQIIEINTDIANIQDDIKATKADPANIVKSGKDKGERRWNVNEQIELKEESVKELQATKKEVAATLRNRFGVIAIADKSIIEYDMMISNVRAWGLAGFTFLILLVFEVCMRYNSRYDYIEHLEDTANSNSNQRNGRVNRTTLSKPYTSATNTQSYANNTLEPGQVGFAIGRQNSPSVATQNPVHRTTHSRQTEQTEPHEMETETEAQTSVRRLPDGKQRQRPEQTIRLSTSTQRQTDALETEHRPAPNRTFETEAPKASSTEIERIKRRIRERFKAYCKYIGKPEEAEKAAMYEEDYNWLTALGYVISEYPDTKKLKIEAPQ